MSILKGGIFSRPSGKTGGIVFGAARTRAGKLVTSRELVPPSNPNTVAQQTQRSKFAEAIAIVRLIGSGIYQGNWNRAIGQLPGFQSLVSVYLNALNSVFDITTIPPINLGSLHMANTFSIASGGATGQIAVTFSTENGINGTASDTLTLIGVDTNPSSSPLERTVVTSTTVLRSAGSTVLSGFGSLTPVSVLGYFVGAGSASGLLSPTKFGQATAGL